MTPAARLAALDCGFRASYLDYATLTAQLERWALAFPDLCRLRALGETTEGRAIWHLTIGREPDRLRPAVWVDGNMHASELAGSSVALAIAEDALAYGESKGSSTDRRLTYLVRGAGELKLRVGSCRVGWTTLDVPLGDPDALRERQRGTEP